MKNPVLFLFLFILAASCISEHDTPDLQPQGTRIKVGDSLPSFSVLMADGTCVTRDSLCGKRAVLVFFHTQCSDCRVQLPRIDSLYRTCASLSDFQLLCIARQEGHETIERFWQQNHLCMPFSPQPTRDIYNLFAYTQVPRIYIASPDGVVRFIHDDVSMPTFSLLFEQLNLVKQ